MKTYRARACLLQEDLVKGFQVRLQVGQELCSVGVTQRQRGCLYMGTHTAGAREQAHGMAQTLLGGFLCLCPFSVPETNIDLLPCEKAHSDTAYSHPFSMPRAYHMLIYCGVAELGLQSCFMFVD